MKPTHLVLCGLLLATPFLHAADSPGSAYEQAVQAYVDAAGQEVRALRVQADALTRGVAPDVRERYAESYRLIAACEKALGALKEATAKNFDQLKARYEAGREAAKKAIAEASGT